MAKIGGRSAWLAWPAGLVCAGVVVALLVLAIPGIPGAVDFIGSTLRGATSAPVAEGDEPQAAPATDCRSLYPDRLWTELTWTPDVLLSQDAAAPATATALTAALSPTVRFSCTWRTEGGGPSIQTTLADVGADAAPIAQAALSADGFSCAVADDVVHCEREAGDVTEIHDLRGGVWLSSVLTRWKPSDYGAQTASRAFAG